MQLNVWRLMLSYQIVEYCILNAAVNEVTIGSKVSNFAIHLSIYYNMDITGF